jgi:hypothetical protein
LKSGWRTGISTKSNFVVCVENARAFRADAVPGRWVIETRHHDGGWEVIVEPDQLERLLVVVTAYPTGETT